ncbi:HD domain-containing protein [Candidatus Kaiserbacteria bacterium]|nr:HD domain-containing protein [Candidatus Kaiserbacteria bacterium]
MSYRYNPIYPHFQGNKLTRTELMERTTIETILKSKIPDKNRSWGKVFELKHASAVTQIGRILAQKRGLDGDLAAIICTMHDIYVFTTGRTTDHAHKSAVIAEKLLRKNKKFTEAEIKLIRGAIYNHSDKHIVSKNPYHELVKDADVLDCGLYDGVHDAYVYEKPRALCKKYFQRIKNVRKELHLPKDFRWDSLDYIEQGKGYHAKGRY